MAEEMTIENLPWESDEAEDSESDEAFDEGEDSAEDFGERARRRRPAKRYLRSVHRVNGVRGVALRGQDGKVRNLAFPAPVATAAETNRGLANQEIARRALDERLERLETRARMQKKNDSSAAGVVTLLIGGGLSAYGAFEASKKSTGSLLGNWANETTTQMAAVASLSQIATSGAKLAIDGRYHGSRFGMAADAFAAVQLTAFAFGTLYKPVPTIGVADHNALQAQQRAGTLQLGYRYVVVDSGDEYETFSDSSNHILFRRAAR